MRRSSNRIRFQSAGAHRERVDLTGLEGYFLVPLPAGRKAPRMVGWPRLRRTAKDLASHRGNVGLLLGDVYSCGGGFLELDIDDPKALSPVRAALHAEGLSSDAVIRSGGSHRGWKILIWLRVHAWAWDWRGATESLPADVRGSVKQAVIPPSAVEVPYQWIEPLPSLDELWDRVDDRPMDFEGRLYRVLYGHGPEEAPECGGDAPLPETLPEDLRRVLGALAGAGVRFGNGGFGRVEDGLIMEHGGGLLGVRLHACPACGGCGDHGRGSFGPGSAWVTPGGRLACFHATCEAAHEDGGLPLGTWLPLYFPDLAPAVTEQPPTREPLTLAEGREAIRSELCDALNEAAGAPGRVILLDATVGLGKSEAALRDAVNAALAGLTYPIFAKRHDLIEELVERARGIATELGHPYLEIVHVKGMARACERWGGALSRARAYCSRPPTSFCRACDARGSCEYQRTMARVGEPGVLVFAPHELARRLISKYPPDRTPALFDELPQPFETVRFPEDDLRAVAEPTFFPVRPGSSGEDAADAWYNARREAARCYLRIVAAGAGAMPPRGWTQHLQGDELCRVLPGDTAEALSYDPAEGTHPSFTPGDMRSGDRPEEGRHVRRDFDDLTRAWRAWLAGAGDLDAGMPTVYRDGDDGAGVAIIRRRRILPDKHGSVILAAGSTGLLSLLRAAWPGRTVEACAVHVEETEHVERFGIKSGAFGKRNLSAPARRQRAFRKTVLQLLPALADWRVRLFLADPGRVLTVGIACPLRLEGDIRAQAGAVGEALSFLEAIGCRVDWRAVGHFGALEGSNAFETVDVLLLLGDEIPNHSESEVIAAGLHLEAARAGVDRAGSVEHGEGDAFLTGAKLSGMIADYLAAQTEGRARGINRTAELPCLICRVGNRMERFDWRIPAGRRAPDPRTVAAQIVAGSMLRGLGWTAAPAVAAILAMRGDQGLGAGFPGNCD